MKENEKFKDEYAKKRAKDVIIIKAHNLFLTSLCYIKENAYTRDYKRVQREYADFDRYR